MDDLAALVGDYCSFCPIHPLVNWRSFHRRRFIARSFHRGSFHHDVEKW
jgi:hypothetical protein